MTVVLLAFLAAPNIVVNGDSFLAVPTARSLLHDGDLDLSEYADVESVSSHYGAVRNDGALVDYFPWTTSLFAMPAVAVVDIASTVMGTPSVNDLVREDRTWPLQLVSGSLIAALVTLLMAELSLLVLTAALPTSALLRRLTPAKVMVLIALTTSLWSTVSRGLWQHGPSLLLVSTALLVLTRSAVRTDATINQRTAAAAGFLMGLAYWFRPTNAVAVAGVALLVAILGRRSLITYLLGVGLAMATVGLANVGLTGGVFPAYYSAGRIGWHAEYVAAVGANLVSPSRGLLFTFPQVLFVPAGVVALRRSSSSFLRGFAPVAVLVTLGLVAGVSGFTAQWVAGHSYGARFLIESLPFLVPLALVGTVLVADHAVAAGSRRILPVIASVWLVAGVIHMEGAVFHATTCWNGAPVDVEQQPSRVWSVRDPQFLSGFRAVRSQGLKDALVARCEDPGAS